MEKQTKEFILDREKEGTTTEGFEFLFYQKTGKLQAQS